MGEKKLTAEHCAKTIESISGVAKTYLRVSKIKTGLTVFLIGYATIKLTTAFIKN